MLQCLWVLNRGQMEYGEGVAVRSAPITPNFLKCYGNYSDQCL